MEKKGKVLITDANYKHTLGAIRSLSKSGFSVDAISDNVSLARCSRYLKKASFRDSNFNEQNIDLFTNFLKKSNYDVLLPIGAKSVLFTAKYKELFEKYVKIPFPSYDKVSFCLDKYKIKNTSSSIGLNVPKSWSFNSFHELKNKIDDIEYPVVIKGRNEIFNKNPEYASNHDSLLKILNSWQSKLDIMNLSEVIIEKRVIGDGYGFFALYRYGKCVQFFMHKRIREFPITGGPSTCAESVYNEDLLEHGKKLLDYIKWHGVAMVEFIRDNLTKEFYVIETNPKFWGSLDLAIECGVDFPTLAVEMAMGNELDINKDYKIGVKYHWPLNGEMLHLINRPRSFFSIIKDLFDPKVKSNIILRDPLPILLSALKEIKSLIIYVKSTILS